MAPDPQDIASPDNEDLDSMSLISLKLKYKQVSGSDARPSWNKAELINEIRQPKPKKPLQVFMAEQGLSDGFKTRFLHWCNNGRPAPNQSRESSEAAGPETAREPLTRESSTSPAAPASGGLPPLDQARLGAAAGFAAGGPAQADIGTFSPSEREYGFRSNNTSPQAPSRGPAKETSGGTGFTVEEQLLSKETKSFPGIAPPLTDLRVKRDVTDEIPAKNPTIQDLIDLGFLKENKRRLDSGGSGSSTWRIPRPRGSTEVEEENRKTFRIHVMYDELRSSARQYLPDFSALAPTCSRQNGCPDEVPVHVRVNWKDLTSINVIDATFEADVEITFSWLIRNTLDGITELQQQMERESIWKPLYKLRNKVVTKSGSLPKETFRVSSRQLNSKGKMLNPDVIETYWPGWKEWRAEELGDEDSDDEIPREDVSQYPVSFPISESHSVSAPARPALSKVDTSYTGQLQMTEVSSPGDHVSSGDPKSKDSLVDLRDPEIVELELVVDLVDGRYSATPNIKAFPFDDIECGIQLEFLEPFGNYQAHIRRRGDTHARVLGSQRSVGEFLDTSEHFDTSPRSRSLSERSNSDALSSSSSGDQSSPVKPVVDGNGTSHYLSGKGRGLSMVVASVSTEGGETLEEKDAAPPDRNGMTEEKGAERGDQVQDSRPSSKQSPVPKKMKRIDEHSVENMLETGLESRNSSEFDSLSKRSHQGRTGFGKTCNLWLRKCFMGPVAAVCYVWVHFKLGVQAFLYTASDRIQRIRCCASNAVLPTGQAPVLNRRPLTQTKRSLQQVYKDPGKAALAKLQQIWSTDDAWQPEEELKKIRNATDFDGNPKVGSGDDGKIRQDACKLLDHKMDEVQDYIHCPILRPCIDLVPVPGRMRLRVDHSYVTGKPHQVRDDTRWGVEDDYDRDSAVLTVKMNPTPMEDLYNTIATPCLQVSVAICRKDIFWWNAIFPLFAFMLLSLFSMLVPPEEFADRCSITLMLLLTIAAMQAPDSVRGLSKLDYHYYQAEIFILLVTLKDSILCFYITYQHSLDTDNGEEDDDGDDEPSYYLQNILGTPIYLIELILAGLALCIWLVQFGLLLRSKQFRKFNTNERPGFELIDDLKPLKSDERRRYMIMKDEFAVFAHNQWRVQHREEERKIKHEPPYAKWIHKEDFTEPKDQDGNLEPPKDKDGKLKNRGFTAGKYVNIDQALKKIYAFDEPLGTELLLHRSAPFIDAFLTAKEYPTYSTAVQAAYAHEARLGWEEHYHKHQMGQQHWEDWRKKPYWRKLDRPFTDLRRSEQIEYVRTVKMACSFVSWADFLHKTINNVFNLDRDDMVGSEEFHTSTVAKGRRTNVPLEHGDIVSYEDPKTGEPGIGVVKNWKYRKTDSFTGKLFKILPLKDRTGRQNSQEDSLGQKKESNEEKVTTVIYVPEPWIKWEGVTCLDFELSMLLRSDWFYNTEGWNLMSETSHLACKRQRRLLNESFNQLNSIDGAQGNVRAFTGRLTVPSGMLADA